MKETLTVAAYEGARVGVQRKATASDVLRQCESVLEARNVDWDQIIITPNNFDDLEALDPIVIEITAPVESNCFFRRILALFNEPKMETKLRIIWRVRQRLV